MSLCCICLTKLTDKGIVILKCQHKIHLNCYIECLLNNTIFCPLCRQIIDDHIKYYNFINKKMNFIYDNWKKNEKNYKKILLIIIIYYKIVK
jgi:uncharacterized C2H2 Zn-finger protein